MAMKTEVSLSQALRRWFMLSASCFCSGSILFSFEFWRMYFNFVSFFNFDTHPQYVIELVCLY